jgi:TonB family protein
MGIGRTFATVLAAAVTVSAAASGARAADDAVRRLGLKQADSVYPPAARALNLPGRAVLSCTAAADGAIYDCQVAREDPAEWGFGASAMLAAATINVGPGAEGRRVQVPVGFHLQPDEVGADPATKTPGFYIPDDQIKWLERPTVQDFLMTYPPEAVRHDIEGYAALACRVTTDGRLDACAVVQEQPFNAGFDKAALALAAKFRMAPRLADGRAIANGVILQGMSWSTH